VGKEGVEVIIDIIATAMAGGLTVFDLEDVELAYSPQWGNPKHGINMMAYVAANMIRGDVDMMYPDEMPEETLIIDVRGPQFTKKGVITGCTIMPAGKLRKEYDSLPKDRPIALVCNVGRNSYMAYRFLKAKGFDVYDLCGGLNTWKWYHPGRVEVPEGDY
jgi:rhodanese-related sulfurtransferase